MVEYGLHEYAEEEVQTLTEYLRNCARQERIAHYDGAHNWPVRILAESLTPKEPR
jgi:hypothetical protein